jgi:hypothetical protein
LGEFSESVERVDVRRLAPASDGGGVKIHGLEGLAPGLILIRIIKEETHGMTNEILGSRLKSKLLVNL